MSELKELAAEAKHELLTHIIPFWRGMRDDKFGGYYGYLSYDLALDEKAEKVSESKHLPAIFWSQAYAIIVSTISENRNSSWPGNNGR